jgi:hypothetical protein
VHFHLKKHVYSLLSESIVVAYRFMNTFELEIWDDESEYVTFYTVRWEGAETSETDKFFSRMKGLPDMQQPLHELANLISEVIGNHHGAHEAFFNRMENWAIALPPKGKVRLGEINVEYAGFPLRLYCYRVTDELVILFNGGIKTGRTAQDSQELSMKFYEANEFTKRILMVINAGEIFPDGRLLKNDEGQTEFTI